MTALSHRHAARCRGALFSCWLGRSLAVLVSLGTLLGSGSLHAAPTLSNLRDARLHAQAELTRVVDELNEQRVVITSAAYSADRDQALRAISASQQFDLAIDRAWIAFMGSPLSKLEQQHAKAFHEALVSYRWERDTTLRLASTYYYTRAREHIDSHANPAYQQLRDRLMQLVDLHAGGVPAELVPVAAGSRFGMLQNTSWLAAVVLLILVLALATPLTRSLQNIVRPRRPGSTAALTPLHSPKERTPLRAPDSAALSGQASAGRTVHSLAQRVSETLARLLKRNSRQLQSLDELATQVAGMNDSLQHQATHTQEASRIADQACQLGEQGSKLNEAAIARMDELGGSSEQITGIIGTINEIAFQTNILALNASVEAARAGEQGKGFAVVASEVRSLAQRSAEAAQEIQALISENNSVVKAAAAQVSESGQATGTLLENIRQVSTLLDDLAARSLQQQQTLHDIAALVSTQERGVTRNESLLSELQQDSHALEDQLDRSR